MALVKSLCISGNYSPKFPAISCAYLQNDKDFVVGRRPLTFNINELVTSANLAPTDVPTSTFQSAADYFEALAEQHLSHLQNQRNDAVTDEADCQKKFVARCLFRKITRNISVEHGSYRLYCDDFRPSNIIVDVKRFYVNAVIDWEFTYVAPAEFTYVAPWWLMLQSPEDWDSDSNLNDFLSRYKPRLNLFLEVLRSCEDEKISEGTLLDSQRLAACMESSMENGLFWNFLDKMYYGPLESIEDRIQLLDEQERKELGEIFLVKVEQAREGKLDENYSTDALVDL
ncbi:hypothetical protein B7463_g12543, partial [Scytalidium lignicola]